jgi:hypothetical protein
MCADVAIDPHTRKLPSNCTVRGRTKVANDHPSSATERTAARKVADFAFLLRRQAGQKREVGECLTYTSTRRVFQGFLGFRPSKPGPPNSGRSVSECFGLNLPKHANQTRPQSSDDLTRVKFANFTCEHPGRVQVELN